MKTQHTKDRTTDNGHHYLIWAAVCFGFLALAGVGIQWGRVRSVRSAVTREKNDTQKIKKCAIALAELQQEKQMREKYGGKDEGKDILGFLDSRARNRRIIPTQNTPDKPRRKLTPKDKVPYEEASYLLALDEVTREKLAGFLFDITKERPFLELKELKMIPKRIKGTKATEWKSTLTISNRYPVLAGGGNSP